MPRVEVAHAVQVVGVGGCGGADVATLDVAEHVEALLGRVFAGHRVDVHAGGAERLVHGDLRFDGGHDVGDGVNDRAVVFEVGDGQLRGFDFLRGFDRVTHLVGKARHDLRRHQRLSGVKAHDAGVLSVVNRFDQAIHAAPCVIYRRLNISWEPMIVARGVR